MRENQSQISAESFAAAEMARVKAICSQNTQRVQYFSFSSALSFQCLINSENQSWITKYSIAVLSSRQSEDLFHFNFLASERCDRFRSLGLSGHVELNCERIFLLLGEKNRN